METVRRICPRCRAPNARDAETCVQCGAEMSGGLPTIREIKLPVPWREVGASLALGVATLAVRAGWHMIQALLERQSNKPVSLHRDQPARDLAERKPGRRYEAQRATGSEPQVRVWGRRISGICHGDGSSQWEVEEFTWERQP